MDSSQSFHILGKFVSEKCPYELLLMVLEFLQLHECVELGMSCKMFHKLALHHLKGKRIPEEKEFINFISRKVEWMDSLIEIDAFDHDKLLYYGVVIWKEKLEVDFISPLRLRKGGYLMYNEKEKEKERRKNEIEKRKTKAMQSIFSKCQPQEKHLLEEICVGVIKDKKLKGVLGSIILSSFISNPHFDIFFEDHLILKTIIREKKPRFYDFSENLSKVVLSSGKYDAKTMTFIPPELGSNDITTPIITWYDYATNPDQNFDLFTEHWSNSCIITWRSGRSSFPFMCFRYWNYLGIKKVKIWRKTFSLLSEKYEENMSFRTFFDFMLGEDSFVEVVDREKWSDEKEAEKTKTLYQLCFQRGGDEGGKGECVKFELIEKLNQPMFLCDLHMLVDPEIRISIYLFMFIMKKGNHLFPDKWYEHDDLMKKMMVYCLGQGREDKFEYCLSKKFDGLKSLSFALGENNGAVFTKFQGVIWESIIELYQSLQGDYYSSDSRILDVIIEEGKMDVGLSTLRYLMEKDAVNDLFAYLLTERSSDVSKEIVEGLKLEENQGLLISLFDYSLSKFVDGSQLSFGRLQQLTRCRRDLDYLFLYILAIFEKEMPDRLKRYDYIFGKIPKSAWEGTKGKSVVLKELKVCERYYLDEDEVECRCLEKLGKEHLDEFSTDILRT